MNVYLMRCICMLLVVVLVMGYPRKNVALLKESNQSDLYDGYPLYAKYANDGVLDQVIVWGSTHCSHTMVNKQYYWWAVDLGSVYEIDSITIYNRADCCGERLNNYYIIAYNPDVPSWSDYWTANASLCYYHAGISPSILNLACNSKTSGRFIEIFKFYKQLYYTADALTLCEVQIYAYNTDTVAKFCRVPSKRPLLHLTTVQVVTRKMDCAITCSRCANCLGFDTGLDNNCDLYQTSMTEPTPYSTSFYYERC